MWHGLNIRLHEGTVVHLTDLQSADLNNEPCVVQQFSAEKEKWVVQPQHPRFEGKKILVAEHNLVFGYCLLPQSPGSTTAHKCVRILEKQGSCGGGLATSGDCPRGTVLFKEAPFIISPTGVGSMWDQRWRAYLTMMMRAKSDPAFRQVLECFEKLTPGNEDDSDGRQKVKAHAYRLFDEAMELQARANGGAPSPDASVREEQVASVFSALLKWQQNQFRFENGFPKGAAAIFSFTAQMNHSCVPSVIVEPQWSPLVPGKNSELDGRIIARTACHVQAGDALCINYGPKELLTWSLEKRRAYLLEKNGFLCQCQRCVLESQRETSAASDTPTTTAPIRSDAAQQQTGQVESSEEAPPGEKPDAPGGEWLAHLNSTGSSKSKGRKKSASKNKKK
ncbi:hypothetical protein CYMTET_33223 [Cymbomonas tetramitiformis]|uniref:SET domain-containing protein n=1 Tax=Cymbomonas tetramitiformis TaxID=36881 RepID=A0AAE0KR61_9CHLO|nr:hypothetical protein CYMTET_33223 [Cymbomonas tetramitiformis]|eukprot:gene17131-20369_t